MNANNPDRQVRRGDIITRVNHSRGDAEAILKTCQENEHLVLRIERSWKAVVEAFERGGGPAPQKATEEEDPEFDDVVAKLPPPREKSEPVDAEASPATTAEDEQAEKAKQEEAKRRAENEIKEDDPIEVQLEKVKNNIMRLAKEEEEEKQKNGA